MAIHRQDRRKASANKVDSGRGNFVRLYSLFTGYHDKTDPLAVEDGMPAAFDIMVVDENIIALVPDDESISFFDIVPLDSTGLPRVQSLFVTTTGSDEATCENGSNDDAQFQESGAVAGDNKRLGANEAGQQKGDYANQNGNNKVY